MLPLRCFLTSSDEAVQSNGARLQALGGYCGKERQARLPHPGSRTGIYCRIVCDYIGAHSQSAHAVQDMHGLRPCCSPGTGCNCRCKIDGMRCDTGLLQQSTSLFPPGLRGEVLQLSCELGAECLWRLWHSKSSTKSRSDSIAKVIALRKQGVHCALGPRVARFGFKVKGFPRLFCPFFNTCASAVLNMLQCTFWPCTCLDPGVRALQSLHFCA